MHPLPDVEPWTGDINHAYEMGLRNMARSSLLPSISLLCATHDFAFWVKQ